MVGGDDSVVTPAPAAGAEQQGEAGESCRNDEGGAAQPAAHHERRGGDGGAEQPADGGQGVGRGPVGRLGVLQVVQAAVVEEPAQLRVRARPSRSARRRRRSARARRRRSGCSRPCGPRRRSGAGPCTSPSSAAAPRARSGSRRRRASRRRRWRPACRSTGPSRPRTPSGRRPGGPPCHGPGRRWPRRRRRGAPARGVQVALQRDEGAGDERALVLAQRQEGRQHHDLAAQPGQRDGLPLLVDQRHGLRRGPVEDQALARRRRRRRGRPAGGEHHAQSERGEQRAEAPDAAARTAEQVHGDGHGEGGVARRGAKRVRRRPPRGAGT